MCVDTGECVDICDTLSQQMYVISFRRREREGKMKESKQTPPPQKKPSEWKKASGFSGITGSWITVVNFEMDDTRRGDKAGADRSLCCLEVK